MDLWIPRQSPTFACNSTAGVAPCGIAPEGGLWPCLPLVLACERTIALHVVTGTSARLITGTSAHVKFIGPCACPTSSSRASAPLHPPSVHPPLVSPIAGKHRASITGGRGPGGSSCWRSFGLPLACAGDAVDHVHCGPPASLMRTVPASRAPWPQSPSVTPQVGIVSQPKSAGVVREFSVTWFCTGLSRLDTCSLWCCRYTVYVMSINHWL